MRSISDEKMEDLLTYLQSNEIDALLIDDTETARTVNLQYFSGHPTDAKMIITSSGETCLIPWDLSLAKDHAQVDEIIDVTNFQMSSFAAIADYIGKKVKKSTPQIGILPHTPYGNVLALQKRLLNCKIFPEPIKIDQKIGELRSTKTSYELDRLVEVTKLSDEVLKDIIRFAKNATEETENDLSFLVMKRMRELGAEDNSFPSLVANTDRGYQLHCHPYSSNAQFAKQGLSIIDFGAKMRGYCSDTTQPFAFGSLSPEQERMISIAQKAYDESVQAIDVGVSLHEIAQISKNILEDAGYPMVYALGHGIGLSEHDFPYVSPKPQDEFRLKYWQDIKVEEGMVFTIEPGAYVPGEGGFRIENDVMVRNGKVEIITNAKFLHIE